MASRAMAASARLERLEPYPGRFPLLSERWSGPTEQITALAASGDTKGLVESLLCVSAIPPKAPCILSEPDADGKVAVELPLTRREAERIRDASSGSPFLPALRDVTPIELPWKGDLRPTWSGAKRWGPEIKPEALSCGDKIELCSLLAREFDAGSIELVTRQEQVKLICPAFVVRRDLNGKLRLKDVSVVTEGRDSLYVRNVRHKLAESLERDFFYQLDADARRLLEETRPGTAYQLHLHDFGISGIGVTDQAVVLTLDFRLAVQ